jgi:hypothetical protein
LPSSQPVACHSAGTIGQIDLQVLVDAIVIVFSALRHNLSSRAMQLGWLIWNGFRLWRIVGDYPKPFNQMCTGDLALLAIASHGTLRDAPSFCQLFCRSVFHYLHPLLIFFQPSSKISNNDIRSRDFVLGKKVEKSWIFEKSFRG